MSSSNRQPCALNQKPFDHKYNTIPLSHGTPPVHARILCKGNYYACLTLLQRKVLKCKLLLCHTLTKSIFTYKYVTLLVSVSGVWNKGQAHRIIAHAWRVFREQYYARVILAAITISEKHTYLSRDMWFPTMWHFDKTLCRRRQACLASF